MIIDRSDLRRALPRYELGEELGRGAFGLVVAARHTSLGRRDAIKILTVDREFPDDPTETNRFAAEARALATLDHPHVVRVYDYLEQGDLRLIVMEYLPGGTFRTWSKSHRSIEASCAVGLSVAAALSCAHENHVLHRDIKPDNILFAADGTPKVGDFGIAKILEGSTASLSAASGTPRYMAPEQFDGARLTPATDVYALGVMLYERFAGRPLFDPQLSVTALMRYHLEVAPAPLVEAPAQLAAVVTAALAKDPARRPSSARQFAVELAEAAAAALGPVWLSHSGVRTHLADEVREAAGTLRSGARSRSGPSSSQLSDRPSDRPSGPRPVRRSRGLALAAAGAALVVGLTAVGLVLTSGRGDEPGSGPPVTATPPDSSAAAPGPPARLTATPTATITLPVTDTTQVIGLSADGTRLVTTQSGLPGVGGPVVTVYATDTGKVVAQLANRPNTGAIVQAAISPDNSTVALATYGYLMLWDVATAQPRELARASDAGGAAFVGVAFLDGGSSLAAISTDYRDNHQLLRFDPTTGKLTSRTPSPDPGPQVAAMVADPAGSRLAVAMFNQVVVWDVATPAPVVVPAPQAPASRWFESPVGWTDSTTLVSCVTGADGELLGHAAVDLDLRSRSASQVPGVPAGAGGCGVSTGPVRIAGVEADSPPGVVVVRDPSTGTALAQVVATDGTVAGGGLANDDLANDDVADGGLADGGPGRGLRPYLSPDGRVLAVRDGDQVRTWTLAGT